MPGKERVVWDHKNQEWRTKYQAEEVMANDPNAWASFFQDGALNSSGVPVNAEIAMRFATVAMCVRIRSNTMAEIDFRVMRNGTGKDKGKVVEYTAHPANELLRHAPNTEHDPNVFKKLLQSSQDLQGNAMAWISRARSGKPVELIPIWANQCHPYRENGKLWYSTALDGTPFRVPPADIIHLMPFPDDTGIYGRVPFRDMSDTIGAGIAGRDYVTRLLTRGGTIGSVIETLEGFKNEQQAQKFKDEWTERYEGFMNAGKTAVLPPGRKFTPVKMMNSTDAQHLENRKYTRDELLGFYNIPPHMAGVLDKVNYNNITALDIQFIKTCVAPMVRPWKEQLERKLLTPEERRRGVHIKIDVDALVKADVKTHNDLTLARVAAGLLNRNEGREELGYQRADDPALNEYLQPVNLQTAEQLANSNQPTQPDPAPTVEPDPDDDTDDEDENDEDARSWATPIVKRLTQIAQKRFASDATRVLKQCRDHDDTDDEIAEALLGMGDTLAPIYERSLDPLRESLAAAGKKDLRADAGLTVFNDMLGELAEALNNGTETELLDSWRDMGGDADEMTDHVLENPK